MSAPTLSAVVVAHNEAHQLDQCLACLAPADELVVVLDRCSDGSRGIAEAHAAKIIEGAWPLEGDRRNTGLDASTGDGNTSEPKIAGTPSASICSMSATTSDGDGSPKSAGWIAPMTVQP